MGKTLVYILFTVITASVSSCQKTYSCSTDCRVCKKANENDVSICEVDYDSHTAASTAIDAYEAQDYDCSLYNRKAVKASSDAERKNLETAGYFCVMDI